VIEILLEAERTLAVGRLDEAERLYRQAADADPRNSIAVVGLARVALERGADADAYRFARRALEIDPENVAALRLSQRLEEVYAYRGESIVALAAAEPAVATGSELTEADTAQTSAPASPGAASPPHAASVRPAPPRTLVDRLFRRNRS
jgi:tetratricopeptide (TPR) repeat protein